MNGCPVLTCDSAASYCCHVLQWAAFFLSGIAEHFCMKCLLYSGRHIILFCSHVMYPLDAFEYVSTEDVMNLSFELNTKFCSSKSDETKTVHTITCEWHWQH